jgi:hypothetical protein
MMDAQGELVGDIGRLRIGYSPKLFEDRSLCSLHLSVQVRRAWRDWPEPYGLVHQTALDAFGKELGASIRLEPLDRERHFLQHLVEKHQSGLG